MGQIIRKPFKTYHHGDLREALIQVALREVELGGPEAISIKALAKQLGVSQPAPYPHFADREAVLEEDVDVLLAEAGVRYERFTAAHAAGTPGAMGVVRRAWDLTEIGRAYERFVAEQKPLLSGVTVRSSDGQTHEFEASAETLKDLKVGDRIEAKRRPTSN